jgi:hypothetical protein
MKSSRAPLTSGSVRTLIERTNLFKRIEAASRFEAPAGAHPNDMPLSDRLESGTQA